MGTVRGYWALLGQISACCQVPGEFRPLQRAQSSYAVTGEKPNFREHVLGILAACKEHAHNRTLRVVWLTSSASPVLVHCQVCSLFADVPWQFIQMLTGLNISGNVFVPSQSFGLSSPAPRGKLVYTLEPLVPHSVVEYGRVQYDAVQGSVQLQRGLLCHCALAKASSSLGACQ